jgi:hypothetical protein
MRKRDAGFDPLETLGALGFFILALGLFLGTTALIAWILCWMLALAGIEIAFLPMAIGVGVLRLLL